MKQRGSKLLGLTAVIIGSAVVIIDGMVVNLALPKIAAEFHTDFSALQWITDGYMLSLSGLILLGGSLGDIFGRKKIYLLGVVGFALTSLLCAVSPSANFLIIARVLQGITGALMVPGALAIINTMFETSARGKAIGRWTAWSSAAIVLAPVVGGTILALASWRWIFLINVPLAFICYVLASKNITESKDDEPRHFDVPGAVLVSLALAGVTYGLIEGPAHGWNAVTLTCSTGGVALAVLFVFWQKRSRDPMVPLGLFRSRNFSGSNIMTFLMYGALSGYSFSLSLYLQTHLHYSALVAGLTMLPSSLIMISFSSKVGELAAKYGARLFMTVGPLLAGASILLFLPLAPGDSYVWHVLPGTILFGIGLTLMVAPLTTTVMTSVSDRQSGTASGINNAVSRVAGLIIIASLGFAGANSTFQFAMLLCFFLATASGVISFVMIRSPKKHHAVAHD